MVPASVVVALLGNIFAIFLYIFFLSRSKIRSAGCELDIISCILHLVLLPTVEPSTLSSVWSAHNNREKSCINYILEMSSE